jgi:pimeloyl-ACP methyl ester carboxylesterase
MCARVVTTVIALLVLAPRPAATQSGGARAPAPGSLFLYPERVPLRDGRLASAERGTLFVPVSRADTSRGVISLDVWRFQASAPSDVPPVVLLHGGPGWPGLDGSLENPDYWERVIQPFTAITDLIVIGQRGIGSSKPNTLCENGPPYLASQRCRAYWDSTGLDLSGFTVIEAAADVRDAARALGADQVVIWGVSFGSHWGMAVLRYHPDLVARAVLSGMEGPDHTYDRPTGFLNAMKRYADEAERSPGVRRLFPNGIMTAIDTIRARLSAAAVTVRVPDPKTGEEREMTFGAAAVPGLIDGYSSNIGARSGVAGWPADIYRMSTGDYAHVATTRLGAGQSPGPSREYGTASFFMLDCGSGITAARLKEYTGDPAIPYVGDRSAFYRAACPPWNADLGDAFRDYFDTDVPTAIVQGDRDMSTPYENALELAPHFKRSKLVTVVGGSHGALREALEADSGFATAIWAFVRTGNLGVLPDSVALPAVEWEIPERGGS